MATSARDQPQAAVAERSHELTLRLAHPHYLAQAALCVPFPALVLVHLLDLPNSLPLSSWAVLLFAGVNIVYLLFRLARRNGAGAEVVFTSLCWTGKVFNLISFIFLREPFELSLYWGPAYVFVWLVLDFFFPQPEYLGPSRMDLLTSDEFDEHIAIVPPAPALDPSRDDLVGLGLKNHNPRPASIVELPDPAEQIKIYEKLRNESHVWRVVLFHADWMRRSRELQCTLARLSEELTSDSLTFHLITPESAPTTFYDLDLATTASSSSLPVIFLFYQGRAVAQLPVSRDELVAKRRAERIKRKRMSGVDKEEAESDSEGSEDERQVESEVAWQRRRWDRSAQSIERAFKLRERSGLFKDKDV